MDRMDNPNGGLTGGGLGGARSLTVSAVLNGVRVGLVSVILAGGWLFPLSPGGAQGGDSEPVKVGAVFDLSGATADIGVPYSEGVRDYVTWRNESGDDPRPVELLWADFGYRVAEAERRYEEFVAQGAAAFIGWGTADTEALRPRTTERQIPFVSASTVETLTDPRWTPFNFVPGTTYSDQLRVALRWISEQQGGRHTDVAVFHHDSPFGTSPLEAGRDYINAHHLDIGYKTYAMPVGATDYLAQLDEAARQGARFVIVHNVAAPAAKLIRNLAEGGYGMQVLCLNWCADEEFVRLAGQAAEGVVGVMPWTPPTVDAPGLRPLRAFLASRGGRLEDKGVHYVQGWYTAAALIDGVERAAAGRVTGATVRYQLEHSPGLRTGGVTTEAIRFSSDRHKGLTGSHLFMVEQGRWRPRSGPVTP